VNDERCIYGIRRSQARRKIRSSHRSGESDSTRYDDHRASVRRKLAARRGRRRGSRHYQADIGRAGGKIRAVASQHGIDISGFELIDVSHSEAAAAKAVELIHAARGEMLMKGSLHTDELMRSVTAKTGGLRTERRISHVFVMDVPAYSETIFITDAAINIFPDLECKRDIVQNVIDFYTQAGFGASPRVAILSAVETVTSKIPSTIEAAALCKMADRGQITGGLLDGPLAFDNAIDREAARIKGIKSEVAGRAQILVVPDLEAGNMLAKNLAYFAKADGAGIVLGARVPIVLTSRADSPRARMASCAVATLYADARRRRAQTVAA